MRHSLLKRILTAGCALALLIRTPGTAVYASGPQGEQNVMNVSEIVEDESVQEVGKATVRFSDVSDPSSWYYDAVYWAVEKNVTSGMGKNTFQPMAKLTRAQAVTFLYNMAGKPDVSKLKVKDFSDVPMTAWYYNAVKWATAKKITSGHGEGIFQPNENCNRAMVITFLANYAKMAGTYRTPKYPSNFRDVPENAWYRKSVDWALKYGITSGHGKGRFGSNEICNRAMMVTFLYAYDKVAKKVDSIDINEADLYGYRYTDVEKLGKIIGVLNPLGADGIAFFSTPPLDITIASFNANGEVPYTNHIDLGSKCDFSICGIKVGDSELSGEQKLREMGYELGLNRWGMTVYKNREGEMMNYSLDTNNMIAGIWWGAPYQW